LLGRREGGHRHCGERCESDPEPTRLGVVAVRECADRLGGDVEGEDEEAGGDQLLGAPFGVVGGQAPSGEQPDETSPANASIRLSAPKPISAIEPAAIPAARAIANSMKCQAMPPIARSRACRWRRRWVSSG